VCEHFPHCLQTPITLLTSRLIFFPIKNFITASFRNFTAVLLSYSFIS
jgi:hypothetical protein